jgi:hypothetical protein
MTLRDVRSLAAFIFVLSVASLPSPALAQSEADQKAVMNHRLTIENVKKVFAIDKELLKLAIANPALAQKISNQKPSGLDEAVKLIGSIPEVSAVLKTHDISARDYLLTTVTMTGTAFAYQFSAAGKMPEMPAGMQKDNLEFWKTNVATMKAAVDEWMKTRAELLKRALQPQ